MIVLDKLSSCPSLVTDSPRLPDTARPRGDLYDLAELVAHRTRPAPFYLDADNLHAGHADTLTEAATSGRAYACTVAADVLAWDLDTPEAAAGGDRLAERITADGWPTLRTTSGRTGHRHLWAVVPEPAARVRLTASAAALGLPASRRTMRPPLAPHRLGLEVTALDDLDTFAADVAAVRADARPTRQHWAELLKTGRRRGGGDTSGSAVVWLVCIGAIRDGYGLATVRAWLADADNLGGRSYRARLDRPGRRHADYWLEHHVWPSAAHRAALRPPADATEARDRLDQIAAALDATPMPGTGGATNRAVMRVLLERGYRRGSLTPTMGYRDIAEAAPCALPTVVRAVARLKAAGWLQAAEVGRGVTELAADGTWTENAQATRWRLCLPEGLALTDNTGGTPPASTSLSVITRRGRSVAALDVCRYGGLGLNTPRIVEALDAGSMTALELADRLHLNARHLSGRLLPRLAEHGIVVAAGGRWSLAADLDAALAAAAEALGLVGKTAEVAARHAIERARYLDWREHTRPRRLQAAHDRRMSDLRRRRTRSTAPLPLDASPALVDA